MSLRRRFGIRGEADNWVDKFFNDDKFFSDDFFRPRRQLVEWSDNSSEDSFETYKTPTQRNRKRSESSEMSFKSEEIKESSSRSSSSVGRQFVNSSPRVSNLSGNEPPPTPPTYEEVVGYERPIKDYFHRNDLWDKNIESIVDDFDRQCTQSIQEHRLFTNTNSRLSSAYVDRKTNNMLPHQQQQQQMISSQRRSESRTMTSASGLSPLDTREQSIQQSRSSQFASNSSRILPLSPFMSRFDDPDSIFNRRFGEWDSIWPAMDVSFPDWSQKAIDKDVPVEAVENTEPDKFVLHIDVHGFNHDELVVKTEGQTLVVIAKTKQDPTQEAVDARELRKEFDLPSDVNPLDVVSSLSPEGFLLVEAKRTKLSIEEKPQ